MLLSLSHQWLLFPSLLYESVSYHSVCCMLFSALGVISVSSVGSSLLVRMSNEVGREMSNPESVSPVGYSIMSATIILKKSFTSIYNKLTHNTLSEFL